MLYMKNKTILMLCTPKNQFKQILNETRTTRLNYSQKSWNGFIISNQPIYRTKNLINPVIELLVKLLKQVLLQI